MTGTRSGIITRSDAEGPVTLSFGTVYMLGSTNRVEDDYYFEAELAVIDRSRD